MIRVKIGPSRRQGKKKRAVLEFEDGTKKVVHFGQAGASDYTRHKDPARMLSYLRRHGGLGVPSKNAGGAHKVVRSKREDWGLSGVTTPGFWSRWLLWSAGSEDEAKRIISQKFKRIVFQ